METDCAVDNEAWLVTQQIGTFSPSVEQTFYNEDDAVSYCEIMRRNKPDRKYRVYKAIDLGFNAGLLSTLYTSGSRQPRRRHTQKTPSI